jgi:hypothetical protein
MSDPFQISSIEIRRPVEGSVDDPADDRRESQESSCSRPRSRNLMPWNV